MTVQQIAASLSPAQRKMLLTAAGRFKTNVKQTKETNCVYVGRGQSSTAKKLEALGLGSYNSNGYYAKFWIHERGYRVAKIFGVVPPERTI